MSEEKVYTFNEYVLGYDSGGNNDRSCLTISKILNDNMYVMSTLYDGSAEVISTMLDSLQYKLEQLENIRKEAIEELSYMSTDAYVEDYDIREKHYNLLMNILNKGDNKE